MTTANSEIKILSLPNDRIALLSPYHPEVPSAAKALGGRWNSASKTWSFDNRDTNAVRALCTRVFGVDPLADTPTETVTVRVGAPLVGHDRTCWLFGRSLATRFGRDRTVSLGEDCIIVAGSFSTSGGSARYPSLEPSADLVLEVRDVPKSVAEALIAELDCQLSELTNDLAGGKHVQFAYDVARAKRDAIEIRTTESTESPDQVAHLLDLIRQLSPDDQARLRTALRAPTEAH